MIDYTDVALTASKYNFASKVQKVDTNTVIVEVTDKDTGKRGQFKLTSSVDKPITVDELEAMFHVAKQKLDLIA